MDLQTLSDADLLSLYARATGGQPPVNPGSRVGAAPPSPSWRVAPQPEAPTVDDEWARRLPYAGSTKDQGKLPAPGDPLPYETVITPPAVAGARPLPSRAIKAAPVHSRVSGVFDDIANAPGNSALQAQLAQAAKGYQPPAAPASPGMPAAPASPSSPAGSGLDLSTLSDDELLRLHREKGGAGDGLARNAAAGMNTALFNAFGAPVDAMTWALNKGVQGVNSVAGTDLAEIRNPIGGSQSIADAFGMIGVDDPATVRANTAGERIIRGAAEGAGYAIAPQAAVGGLAKAGALAPSATAWAGRLLGPTTSTGEVVGNAVANAAGGAGAVAAADAVPDPYKPLAGLAGGLTGAAAGTAATALPRAAGGAVRLGREAVAPMTQAGREAIAGQALRDAATDPTAARDALAQRSALVSGSKPTTFQQSGDMGLGALERSVATRNPAEFMQRRADQNAARLGTLEAVQPAGNVGAFVQRLRSTFTSLEQQTEQRVQQALAEAQQKAAAIGGGGTPESYGDTLRTALRSAETEARAQERALWRAVDPDDTLALETGNVKGMAAAIRKEMPETAKPMEGEESAIFEVAARLPSAIKFGAMSALRSRVSTLMRQELMTNGQSQVYGRLSRLRGALEQDVEGVLTARAEQEAEAVAAGTMQPQDTIEARWEAVIGRDIQAWRDNRGQHAGDVALAGTGTASSGRATAVPPGLGAQIEGGGRSANAPGNQGVPQEPIAANFDEAARERLRAANAATKQRARTYGEEPAAGILRRSGSDGPYRLGNAAVPEKLFFAGNRSGEAIARYRQAVGDPQALATLESYAATQLRRAAEATDGTIDPRRLEAWRRRHTDALAAFPGLASRFADAARASETLAEIGARRAAALDAFQAGALGRLLNAAPEDVPRMVGAVFGRQDAYALMTRLARETANDEAARAGLRKAIMDYVLTRYVSNAEAATSGRTLIKADQLQTFLRQNAAVLRAVFSDIELQRMQAVAADLQRSNRSIAAVKLPGGSNTAQDTFAVRKGDDTRTMLAKIIAASAAGGAGGGALSGPIGGAVGAIGAPLVLAMRQAGIQKVEDLIRDAMLNPDRAALLMSKGPVNPQRGAAPALAKRYMRAVLAAEAAEAGERRQGEAR